MAGQASARGSKSDDTRQLWSKYAFDDMEIACRRGLQAFDPPARQKVIAEVRDFRRDFADPSISVADLYHQWDFKQVSSDKRCKQYNVHQIKTNPSRSVRVWMIIDQDEERVVLLDVIRKQGGPQQNKDIATMCDRARRRKQP